MTIENPGGKPTALAAADLDQYTLVKLDSNGKWAAAAASDTFNVVGHLVEQAYTDKPVSVCPLNLGGVQKAIAADTVAVGDEIKQFASGQLGAGGSGTSRGVAFTAAAAGEYFSYIPRPASSAAA